ncbi:MAG: hypothetical protein ABSA46_01615 [Thermodesulfovibrionales bacterium]
MEKKKELTDTLLLAYLSLSGFSITPKNNGRLIAFEVSGESLTDTIETFYRNPEVKILDFITHYKNIRSMIFNLRGQGGRQ